MRAAEGGQEVVKSQLIGEIQYRKGQVGLHFVLMKDIVPSNGGVEEVTGCYPRRITVIVFSAGCRDAHQR